MSLRPGRLLAAALAAAGVAATGLAVTGGAAQAAAVSAALIKALPPPACAAGTTPLTPASAQRTTHGAAVYHYAMASGPGFDAFVPPAGFQPATADDATLLEMNLPARPARAADLAGWTKEMTGYRGTDKPQLCLGSAPRSRTAQTVRTAASGPIFDHASSSNWSGYVEDQGGYTEVAAHWVQTSAHTCNCTGPTDEGTWVGLGGYNADGLLQDGTENYSNTTPTAWFEYLGAVSVYPIYGATTTVGHDISAAVSYSGGAASFGVTDNGVYKVSAAETGLSGDYDGSTAEFINERTANGSGWNTLTNYVKTYWTQARAWRNGTAVAATTSNSLGLVMTSDGADHLPPCTSSTAVLAYPENLSNGTFDSVWCRAS